MGLRRLVTVGLLAVLLLVALTSCSGNCKPCTPQPPVVIKEPCLTKESTIPMLSCSQVSNRADCYAAWIRMALAECGVK